MKDPVLTATEQALVEADAAWVDKLAKTFGEDRVGSMAARSAGSRQFGTELPMAYDARQVALRDLRVARGLE